MSLIGRRCTRVTVDAWSPPLVLWFLYDGPPSRLEINIAFSLTNASSAFAVDPATPSALAPVLDLIGRSVTAFDDSRADGMTIEFTGGAAIRVPSGGTEPWWLEIEQS